MEFSLNAHEARVFGVLIEKAFTTPDQYPLSITAATSGCNQKSNRDPVVDVSEPETRITLQGLRMKGLVGVSQPAGSRVEKYRHNGNEMLKVDDRALAVLAELLLRGPQTSGELRARAKRMRDVSGEGALDAALEALEGGGYLTSAAQGRATRYAQTLCQALALDGDETPPRAQAAPASASVTGPSTKTKSAEPPRAGTTSAGTTSAEGSMFGSAQAADARIAALEGQVAALQATVQQLGADLERLKGELGA